MKTTLPPHFVARRYPDAINSLSYSESVLRGVRRADSFLPLLTRHQWPYCSSQENRIESCKEEQLGTMLPDAFSPTETSQQKLYGRGCAFNIQIAHGHSWTHWSTIFNWSVLTNVQFWLFTHFKQCMYTRGKIDRLWIHQIYIGSLFTKARLLKYLHLVVTIQIWFAETRLGFAKIFLTIFELCLISLVYYLQVCWQN